MIAFTAARDAIRLGDELGRGGEAVVYRVQERHQILAKVYSRSRDDYHQKLRYMRASPPVDPTRALGHASIAWPQELLYDRKRRFIGYLMPHIDGAAPLVSVFNPRRRAAVLPDFNTAYLYRAARNLSSALAALHARGYVVGDLNEQNVLVTPRALVTLIDVDSFQVHEPRDTQIVVYPCPVGRLEYTPPELQGRAFSGVMRSPEHDRFGLAVLIFQLLMSGNHPFRGRWLGDGDPPPVEARIRQGWFPYGPEPPSEIAPPPNAAAFGDLPPMVTDLFMRSFSDGHASPGQRPTAEEWARRLAEAERHLVTCRDGHFFSDHLPRCPTCGAKRRRGGRGSAAPEPIESPSWSRGGKPVPAGTGTAAVVRSPAATVGSTLATAAGVVMAPFVGAQRIVTGWRSALANFQYSLQSLPRRAALGTAQQVQAQGSVTAALDRGRRVLSWTAFLAISAAVAAMSVVYVLTVLGPAAEVSTQLARLLTPGTTAWLIGGLSLGIVGTMRGLGDAPGPRLRAPVARKALAQSVSGFVGWTGGWLIAAIVFRLVVGAPLGIEALTSTGGTAIGASAAWAVGWAIYGASAGALGGTVRDGGPGWAVAGVVFGAAGWIAMRLAAVVLGLTV